MSLLSRPLVIQGTRDGRWSVGGEAEILALVDRIAELELELTRRALAQADERERYQKDRQGWAEKKKAWAAHEDRLKARTLALREALTDASHNAMAHFDRCDGCRITAKNIGAALADVDAAAKQYVDELLAPLQLERDQLREDRNAAYRKLDEIEAAKP